MKPKAIDVVFTVPDSSSDVGEISEDEHNTDSEPYNIESDSESDYQSITTDVSDRDKPTSCSIEVDNTSTDVISEIPDSKN
ncbi:hypothetical protein AYI68_g3700, partial [Smittium mucronatum]